MRAVGPRCPAAPIAAGCLAVAVLLTGCGAAGPSATAAPVMPAPAVPAASGGTAGALPHGSSLASAGGQAGAAGVGAAGAAKAVVPALPTVTQTLGAAGCRRLPAETASRLLAARARAAADRRLVDGRRAQLDGCVYTTATGARLSYVVWQLPRPVTAADTAATLPPAGSGARRFDTTLPLGAAAVLDTAGFATVQVRAGRGRLLVEVNATTTGAPSARSAALGAAGALLR